MDKVLIIGLDGATLDLIRPWVSSGELPTFAALMHEGAYGELRTVLPPLTAPAWATMVTGCNPGMHGLVDFWARDFAGYGFRLLNASSRVLPAFWDLVSEAGGRVVVCNVPMTYPPSPVNGIMVSGMDTPGLDASYTYPAELKDELNRVVGKYVITADDWLFSRRRQYERAGAELFNSIEVRFAAATYLLEKYPWDLGMIVFTETDGAAHFFWQFSDPVHLLYNASSAQRFGATMLQVYKKLDAKLSQFIRSLPESTTLFVLSDHGNGPVSDRAIHLNTWLAKLGLLHFETRTLQGRAQGAVTHGTVRALRFVWQQMRNWIPYQTQVKIEALFPGGGKRIESGLLSTQIDWARTKAFSEEVRGSIWINLEGRDRHGIVAQGQGYQDIVEQILTEVHGLKDPVTGEPLIERAYRREELYRGRFAYLTPDVILEPRDSPQIFRRGGWPSEEAVRRLTKDELRSGDTTGHHRMNGMLFVRGAGAKAGYELPRVDMVDVAPTVLYALGLPIPSWMEGRVVEEAFRQSYLSGRPIRRDALSQSTGTSSDQSIAYSEEEARAVQDRLRGLGYL